MANYLKDAGFLGRYSFFENYFLNFLWEATEELDTVCYLRFFSCLRLVSLGRTGRPGGLKLRPTFA